MIPKSSGLPEFFKGLFLPINLFYGAIAAVILLVLYLISLQNYILFHGIVELAGIAVAFSIFIVVWNTRRDIYDAFFLIVGISFLFIGGIDLIHTLAYKGMGVFPGNNADLPTQIWIAARYFQSITFLIATLFIGRSITRERKYDTGTIIAACGAACALLFASIFIWQNFPHCFIDGSGLTPFKITSEYIISLILIATIIILYYKRAHFDPTVWKFLIAAQMFLIFGELAFTSYISVFGFMNMLGHLFHLLSVYFFYRAFVVISLTRPYDLLLRKLKEDDYALNERFKELNCLYGISALLEQPGVSLHEILEKTVTLLPSALQYPEITEARIVIDGQSFLTAGFRETPWMLAREILVTGNPVGRVEVCYQEERPVVHEGPFMKEERSLVNAVAERTGHIIERMQAEESLRQKTEELDQYFSTSLDLFCIADTQGYFRRLNTEWEKALGYSRADLEGKRFLDFVHPDDLPGTLAAITDLSSQKEVLNFTNRYRHKDGTYRWIEWRSFPKGDRIFAAARDITDRKRVEEALNDSEERYRTIIENIQDVYFRLDKNSRLIMVSPSAASTFGFTTTAEMLGRPALSLWKDPKAREQMIETMRRQGGFVQDWEAEFIKSDGTVFWASVSGRLYTDEQGAYNGTEGIIRDISERKKAGEALKGILKKLNMLSSITRHDILNQVTALRTYLELSRQYLKGTPISEFIEKEDQAAEAIQRQIEFTRFYQDIGVNAPKWQDAGAVIHEAVSQLSPQGILVDVAVAGIEIFADPLIVKVFFNLIENSLRHGERVTQMSFSSRESEEGLIITYRDNGVGITAEDKKKLFQKGFGKHTGLGLFLSREIVAITGITITEKGEPGKGVQFDMTVPAGGYRFAQPGT